MGVVLTNSSLRKNFNISKTYFGYDIVLRI